MPKKAEHVPEDETTQARFKRVANYRAKKLIKYMKMLERMPKQPTYDYTPEDIAKLQEALNKEWENLQNTFNRAIEGNLKGKQKTEVENIFE